MAKGRKTGGRKPGVPNKATRELKELAQPYALEAIQTLREIMEHGETEAARVAAARELLDRGYGRPAGSGTHLNVSTTANSQQALVCTEEQRARLIKLREKLLKEAGAGSRPALEAPKNAVELPEVQNKGSRHRLLTLPNLRNECLNRR
jgi:hypothetical protein